MNESRVRALPAATVAFAIDDGPYAGLHVVAAAASEISIGLVLEFRRPLAGTDDEKNLQAASQLERFGDEVLVDWNLNDKQDRPLPATGESMLRIPQALGFDLLARWIDATQGVSAPLVEPSPSGGQSPAEQEPTALSSRGPQSSRRPSSSSATRSASA